MGSRLTQDVLSHGPQLETDTSQRGKVRRMLIQVVTGVRDLSRRPNSLVGGVLDKRRRPFALRFKRMLALYSNPVKESSKPTL